MKLIKDLFELSQLHDGKILPGLVYMPYIIQQSNNPIIIDENSSIPKIVIKSRYSVVNINNDYLTF